MKNKTQTEHFRTFGLNRIFKALPCLWELRRPKQLSTTQCPDVMLVSMSAVSPLTLWLMEVSMCHSRAFKVFFSFLSHWFCFVCLFVFCFVLFCFVFCFFFLLSSVTYNNYNLTLICITRSRWLGPCNSQKTKHMSRHFYRPIYFSYTFSFVKERQFRSSDAVTSN